MLQYQKALKIRISSMALTNSKMPTDEENLLLSWSDRLIPHPNTLSDFGTILFGCLENSLFAHIENKRQNGVATPCDDACGIGMGALSWDAIRFAQKDCVDSRKPVISQDYKLLYNMALIHLKRRESRLALFLFLKATEIIFNFGDYLRTGLMCWHHIGRIHYLTFRYDDAFNAFTHALRGARSLSKECERQEYATYQTRNRRLISGSLVCLAMTRASIVRRLYPSSANSNVNQVRWPRRYMSRVSSASNKAKERKHLILTRSHFVFRTKQALTNTIRLSFQRCIISECYMPMITDSVKHFNVF